MTSDDRVEIIRFPLHRRMGMTEEIVEALRNATWGDVEGLIEEAAATDRPERRLFLPAGAEQQLRARERAGAASELLWPEARQRDQRRRTELWRLLRQAAAGSALRMHQTGGGTAPEDGPQGS